MYCLYCGDCCKRMSPISQPEPCPYLIEKDSFCFCSVYDHRPKECANHDFPARFCPVGVDVLKLDVHSTDVMRLRIDTGWQMIKDNCGTV